LLFVIFVVRKRGLEPRRPKALPPQDSVSTNFTTSAQRNLSAIGLPPYRAPDSVPSPGAVPNPPKTDGASPLAAADSAKGVTW